MTSKRGFLSAHRNVGARPYTEQRIRFSRTKALHVFSTSTASRTEAASAFFGASRARNYVKPATTIHTKWTVTNALSACHPAHGPGGTS
ncbi:MAG TPA: hypothetical protein DEG43_10840 [Acidimicrobiaceae bacterium]|nr:hypothetical protein [Acidimicrobiaceae bacterium]